MLPEIADALERVNIINPFPIQEMTLSVALMGTDLIGQARTGTGKTLAFGIPVIQRSVAPHDPDYEELVAPGKPQALIVAPTRELALQVSRDLSVASQDRGIRVLTVYGGVPYEPQLDALATGVEVVVGTPGRLIDLMNRRALDISHVKSLVLDEADEMLDLGFLPDVERLLKQTPETRQTMLFSATMPAAIVALARTHMRHPMNIRAESRRGHADGAGHRAVHLPGPRPRQARDARPPAPGRGRRPDDRLHPHQAPGAADRRRPRGARLQLRAPARRHGAGRPRAGADASSARASSRCSSPPTSPPAASTSPASPTS